MQLRELVSAARTKKGAVYAFERGKATRYPFAQLADDTEHARADLLQWGVRPGMRVGIYAPNSYPWLVYDLALMEIGAISVPFTDDFSGMMGQELLDRYNIVLLLLASKDAKLFVPKPRHVAYIDGENHDIAVLERPRPDDADLNDQHSLVFSSGSAGGLKGLVISRKGIEATLPAMMKATGVSPRDRIQLFLPMSNFQQRSTCYGAIWYDCDIVITDYTQLFAAMKALNPTILIAPPIFFEMVFADFERLPAWRRILSLCLGAIAGLLPGRRLRLAAARWIFGELSAQFGNNMRVLLTGMAPIRHDIGNLFKRMQVPLSESYGMLEAGSITFRPAGSSQYGSVGRVLKGIDISFREGGEILVRRESPLTLRYFQCADGENQQTFVAPDTIATGDIGRIDSEGNLFLLGRKKEQIITPAGQKIHPEVIEREVNSCPEVAQSVVFLKPGATQLTCVVDLVQPEGPEARQSVRNFVARLRSTRGTFKFVEVVFAEEAFSTDNGMLRPNMKLDRKRIAARYGQ
jgi:long-subunit acyl-CoA synthetase (AMP-forming)